MLQQVETNVQTFNNANFGELRTQITPEGQVWFCLNDVMKSLGLQHVTELKKRLQERGCSTIAVPTAGGVQQMLFIDEPNLYRCIFQSRKKEAERFQDWVFEEVLPAIRTNGGYIATQQEDTPEVIMARALQVAQATIQRHQQALQIAQAERDHYQAEAIALAPKAEYTDRVLQSTGTLTTNLIALELGMSAIKLNKTLQEKGVQYRQGTQWLLTAKYRDKGLVTMRTHISVSPATGEQKTHSHMVWTEQGRQFIHRLINKH